MIWVSGTPPIIRANICIRFLSAVSTLNILNENIRTARSDISFALSLIRTRWCRKKRRIANYLFSPLGESKSPCASLEARNFSKTNAILRVTFSFFAPPFPLVFLLSFPSWFLHFCPSFALGVLSMTTTVVSADVSVRLELSWIFPTSSKTFGCKLFISRASGYFHFDEFAIDDVLANCEIQMTNF